MRLDAGKSVGIWDEFRAEKFRFCIIYHNSRFCRARIAEYPCAGGSTVFSILERSSIRLNDLFNFQLFIISCFSGDWSQVAVTKKEGMHFILHKADSGENITDRVPAITIIGIPKTGAWHCIKFTIWSMRCFSLLEKFKINFINFELIFWAFAGSREWGKRH